MKSMLDIERFLFKKISAFTLPHFFASIAAFPSFNIWLKQFENSSAIKPRKRFTFWWGT